MSTNPAIEESIESAADAVGSVWPLHSFVTANPLAGLEDQPFHDAVEHAEQTLGGDGYPSPDVFGQALDSGHIDPEILKRYLSDHGYNPDPTVSLDQMNTSNSDTSTAKTTEMERVDAVLTKWLGAFLDQGQAEWAMPNREQGFYEAFMTVAPYDDDIPDSDTLTDLPDDPAGAIQDCLAAYSVGTWQDIFEFHLTALPGWTGFIKQRAANGDVWQSAYPITLTEYLAVRLTISSLFDAPLAPSESPDDESKDTDETAVPLPEVWLRAWEATYRSELVESLTAASAALDANDEEQSGESEPTETDSSGAHDADETRPDAQMVFCIDTRSEIIRRHIESEGTYETHGYAGFFGVPMRYDDHDTDVTVDACPPILDAEHHIAEQPSGDAADSQSSYQRWTNTLSAGNIAIKTLKSNAATAFSFVESAGVGYGAALATRTLLPERVGALTGAVDDRTPDKHESCDLALDHDHDDADELPSGLTLDEQIEYAATAFDLMGWEQFARLVVFTGHASQTANNPFDSSLDCGACAGNPGGPNARVLAAICNDDAVRDRLNERGFDIPEDTVFLAGEHNTTTDEVTLYAEDIDQSHADDIEQLRADLATARAGATAERARDMGSDTDAGVRETQRRAADWAETRPEWGLAGNAGFVIGPRSLTDSLDLDGRAFLHSYDWTTDPDGDALEAIMAGPMVVTQWINTQYYFATVDNAVYGSGSKVTQNPVGNVGVYQGNGGDLMAGLPLQSLMSAADEPYHQPLRLSTVIHAPVESVTEILSEQQQLTELLDNNWLSLTVVDPTQEHRAFYYAGGLEWNPLALQSETPPAVSNTPASADD